MAAFRAEARLTFLHELGHYLGWDEDQVSARGLD
jgi:predicted Zn-dependent protease with MMP-like domain